MPDVIVTTTAARVDVDFNDFASATGMVKGSWNRSMIHSIFDKTDHFEVYVADGNHWLVRSSATTYADAMVIASIDGVTTNTHATLLEELRGLII